MVVYIAGSMRSGTTLIGQLAACSDGLIFAGEVRSSLQHAHSATLCDCGRRAIDCELWSAVDLRAELHGVVRRAYRMRAAIDRRRVGLGAADRAAVATTLAALSRHAAPRFLVDSSKTASGVLLWKRAGQRVDIVHCVRNPLEVIRAQADGATSPHGRPIHWTRTLASWLLHNTMPLLASLVADSYTLVTFRSLRRDPAAVASRVWRAAGVPAGALRADQRSFDVHDSHVLDGSPRRVKNGTVTVSRDAAHRVARDGSRREESRQ